MTQGTLFDLLIACVLLIAGRLEGRGSEIAARGGETPNERHHPADIARAGGFPGILCIFTAEGIP